MENLERNCVSNACGYYEYSEGSISNLSQGTYTDDERFSRFTSEPTGIKLVIL
jgi:hypothetical protein